MVARHGAQVADPFLRPAGVEVDQGDLAVRLALPFRIERQDFFAVSMARSYCFCSRAICALRMSAGISAGDICSAAATAASARG